MASKVKGQAKVQGRPEPTLQDLLTGIDPAKMSKAELLAFAQKAAEMQKVLERTRESERRALLDACLNTFEEKAQILGLSEKAQILGLSAPHLDHIGYVVRNLAQGVSFVEYPKRDTLSKFFDKTIPGLVSSLESFDFTHYIKVGEKEYMVRIRPKAERTKKADKAEQTNQADKTEAEQTEQAEQTE